MDLSFASGIRRQTRRRHLFSEHTSCLKALFFRMQAPWPVETESPDPGQRLRSGRMRWNYLDGEGVPGPHSLVLPQTTAVAPMWPVLGWVHRRVRPRPCPWVVGPSPTGRKGRSGKGWRGTPNGLKGTAWAPWGRRAKSNARKSGKEGWPARGVFYQQ